MSLEEREFLVNNSRKKQLQSIRFAKKIKAEGMKKEDKEPNQCNPDDNNFLRKQEMQGICHLVSDGNTKGTFNYITGAANKKKVEKKILTQFPRIFLLKSLSRSYPERCRTHKWSLNGQATVSDAWKTIKIFPLALGVMCEGTLKGSCSHWRWGWKRWKKKVWKALKALKAHLEKLIIKLIFFIKIF